MSLANENKKNTEDMAGHIQGRSKSNGSHVERSKDSCQRPQLVEEIRPQYPRGDRKN